MSINYTDLNLKVSTKTIDQILDEELANRLKNNSRILSYGVDFLDKVTNGIYPTDLILLGAKTGVGKTQMATLIATHNASLGKSVHYFALEADSNEIERRLKYQEIANLYFSKLKHSITLPCEFSYLNWATGKLDSVFSQYEKEISDLVSDKYKTLHTTYRIGDFTADDFVKAVTSIQNTTDLIILDHFHYVDSNDSNENRGYKEITKKIRDIALLIEKPVIVVAHVRKSDSKNPSLIPGLEDFHGSSDIVKMATKAIMLAPAYDRIAPSKDRWETYVHLAKCRMDGSRTRYVGLIVFDIKTQKYIKKFLVGKSQSPMTSFHELSELEVPEWANDKTQKSAIPLDFKDWVREYD